MPVSGPGGSHGAGLRPHRLRQRDREDSRIDASEVRGYYLSGHDLKRSKGGGVQTLVDSVPTDGLRFTPCRSPGDCPPALAITDKAEIRLLRIELAVEVKRHGQDPARQTLVTDVYLRNRAGQP
jgi:hypothetical protein